MVGNNTPPFFIRDVHNFSDLNRASSATPARTPFRAEQLGFLDLLPECFHQVTVVMSDQGYSRLLPAHALFRGTHVLLLQREERALLVQVPFQKTQQGILNLSNRKPQRSRHVDREYHARTSMRPSSARISRAETMYVQIMTEQQAKTHYENPLDITKIWRHAEYPLWRWRPGAHRNPENYFAEV